MNIFLALHENTDVGSWKIFLQIWDLQYLDLKILAVHKRKDLFKVSDGGGEHEFPLLSSWNIWNLGNWRGFSACWRQALGKLGHLPYVSTIQIIDVSFFKTHLLIFSKTIFCCVVLSKPIFCLISNFSGCLGVVWEEHRNVSDAYSCLSRIFR